MTSAGNSPANAPSLREPSLDAPDRRVDVRLAAGEEAGEDDDADAVVLRLDDARDERPDMMVRNIKC